MVHSIFDEIIAMADDDDYMIRTKLQNMDIFHMFLYAWMEQQPAGNFKSVVLYTAYAYSWESRMIRIGGDWQQQKIRIAHKVGLPTYLFDDIVHLKNKEYATCFSEFLFLYMENMDYVHLTSSKELYQQVMGQATRFQTTEEGNSDLDAKLKYVNKAKELKDEIKHMEDELLEKYRILNAAKQEFEYNQQEHGNPLKLENSSLIK